MTIANEPTHANDSRQASASVSVVKVFGKELLDLNTINSLKNRKNYKATTSMDLTAGDATAVTRTMSTVDIMNYITANLTVLTSNNMWKRFLFPSSLHNNNNTCNLIALWSHKDVDTKFYHHPVPDHISVHRLMDARNCFAQQFRIFDRGIALICIISPLCNNRKQLRGTRTIDRDRGIWSGSPRTISDTAFYDRGSHMGRVILFAVRVSHECEDGVHPPEIPDEEALLQALLIDQRTWGAPTWTHNLQRSVYASPIAPDIPFKLLVLSVELPAEYLSHGGFNSTIHAQVTLKLFLSPMTLLINYCWVNRGFKYHCAVSKLDAISSTRHLLLSLFDQIGVASLGYVSAYTHFMHHYVRNYDEGDYPVCWNSS